MAKAGKHYHWKHGWIPLDAYARSVVAGKKDQLNTGDVKPPAKALARARARQAVARQAHAAKVAREKADDDVTSKTVGSYRYTKVKGYPEANFKEIVEVDRRPPEQYREVAKVVHDVLKPYPKVLDEQPIVIGWSDELPDDVMADTDARGGVIGHRIRLNPHLWDQPGAIMSQVQDMRSRKWGIFASAPDLETFRRDVITHEIGHVLMGLDVDDNQSSYFGGVSYTDGKINDFAEERVTPRRVGYKRVADDARVGSKGMNYPFARWQVDSLGGQSVYATSNKYEFFAEAFLDGTINGDKATESGKRAVAITREIFGPEGTFQQR